MPYSSWSTPSRHTSIHISHPRHRHITLHPPLFIHRLPTSLLTPHLSSTTSSHFHSPPFLHSTLPHSLHPFPTFILSLRFHPNSYLPQILHSSEVHHYQVSFGLLWRTQLLNPHTISPILILNALQNRSDAMSGRGEERVHPHWTPVSGRGQ
jgi:hypothetical protein